MLKTDLGVLMGFGFLKLFYCLANKSHVLVSLSSLSSGFERFHLFL